MDKLISIERAQQLVPQPDLKSSIMNQGGFTEHITEQVISEIERSSDQVHQLAPELKGKCQRTTADNIHSFIRSHIQYIEDPQGEQWIKTPSRVLHDQFCDCKGFTILACSFMNCLKIPHKVRFSARSGNKARHVYPVALIDGQEYPIDPCLPKPNTEHPEHKKIKDMTQISRLSGIGKVDDYINEMIRLEEESDSSPINQGMLELALKRERLALERQLFRTSAFDRDLIFLTDALQAGGNSNAVYALAERAKTAQVNNVFGKVGDFLGKVGDRIRKGVDAAKAAFNKTQQAFANVLLKTLLPRIAPAFLYLFIKDQRLIQRLPAKVKAKRNKALKLARFITTNLGMEESTLMEIARNGIISQMKKTPEKAISDASKGRFTPAVGAIQFAAILPYITSIVGKIIELFQARKEEAGNISAGDMPDLNHDFEGADGTLQNGLENESKRKTPRGSFPTTGGSPSPGQLPMNSSSTNHVPGPAGGLSKLLPIGLVAAFLLMK
ncbi:MAG: hypothetical protein AAFY71_07855 [Bacteroidota bacterium]